MATLKNTKDTAVNEFDQEIKGNSLGKDAWKRLKKNKMAVISIIIVAIYAFLSAFAAFLPIYKYDRIILEHQHLRPSFTKTAGELMLEKKKEELYFQAYRDGRFQISEEQELEVDQMSPNEKWEYFYILGEAGEIELSAREKIQIMRMEKAIRTELDVTVKDVRVDGTKINRLDNEELTALFAQIEGMSIQEAQDNFTSNVYKQVSNNVRSANEGVSDAEIEILIKRELDDLSARSFDKLYANNIISNIEQIAVKESKDAFEKDLEDENVQFPLTKTIEFDDLMIKVNATKIHDRQYYLGTDYAGRDMLSRIIYGGQVSIAIGLIGTLTSVIIGIIVGAFAGYLGGKVDYILMRIVDILYGLPYMLLVIILMAIFGRNILNLFFALAVISWLTVARMVRGQIISLKNSEFVEAARSMGASPSRIIFKHLVPNSLSVIIVFSTLRIPAFIMMESFLSFLGLGVQAPYASWGLLVGDAVEGMSLYPWRMLFPALAMTIFLFAMNFLGDGLRDAFDPQSKNQL